jgi:hypothetical protein
MALSPSVHVSLPLMPFERRDTPRRLVPESTEPRER